MILVKTVAVITTIVIISFSARNKLVNSLLIAITMRIITTDIIKKSQKFKTHRNLISVRFIISFLICYLQQV